MTTTELAGLAGFEPFDIDDVEPAGQGEDHSCFGSNEERGG